MSGGQDDVQRETYESSHRRIESDGERVTLKEREARARKTIAEMLSRISDTLMTIDDKEAAFHCDAAIHSILTRNG